MALLCQSSGSTLPCDRSLANARRRVQSMLSTEEKDSKRSRAMRVITEVIGA